MANFPKFPYLKSNLTDFLDFLLFFRQYLRHRLLHSFYRFEFIKTKLVEGLYRQRGKYVRPFLHTSMIGLVLVGLMLAPLVKGAFLEESPESTNSNYIIGSSSLNSAQTQISVKPRDSVVSYTILSGDTISSIAQKFGVSVETILWQNSLTEKSTIKPGDSLEIPPVTGLVHKVKRGETIHSIAETYSVDAQEIVNWPFNSFSDDETFALATGQLLVVPNGVKPEEKIEKPQPRYIARKTPDAGTIVPSGQFIWPAAGYISQYPVWYHMALDIANPASPDIMAADSGIVVSVQYLKYGYGHHVIVDHGNGYQTLYGHMSNIYVSQGQSIAKGAAIGQMGSTGRSSGIHLHFEVRQNGVTQNPQIYLK
jgi:murein DD-endopeptidase MepM/ murein hydrolase activator NlpD